MPALATSPPELEWSGTLRPPPPAGAGWRRVASFGLDWFDGRPLELSGWAERREGVTLFVGDGLDREGVRERVWDAWATSHRRLRDGTREILAVPSRGVGAGHVGLANLRREVWLIDDALGSQLAIRVRYLLDHELAHNIGGAGGGPPDAIACAWTAAIREDMHHGRRALLGTLGPGRHAHVPFQIGRRGVTAYAEDMGVVEDWAESVALWRADRSTGGELVGPAAARLLTGRGRPLGFARCFPGRARILAELFGS